MDDQEFNLREFLGLLGRQKKVIFLTTIIIFGLAALALYGLQPAYTASTLVHIDPTRKDLLESSSSSGSTSSENALVESEVRIVKSEPVLLDVVERLRLLDDVEFQRQPSLQEKVMVLLRLAEPKKRSAAAILKTGVSKLNRSVGVIRDGLSYLITITATADDPKTATSIANTLTESYIRRQLESKIEAKLAARDIIQERVIDINATVISSEEAIDIYISDNIDRIAAETGRSDLAVLRNDLLEANDARSRLGATIDLANRSLRIGDWQTLAEALQSNSLAELETQFAELKNNLASEVQGTTQYDELSSQLVSMQDQLREEANLQMSALRQQVSESQALSADLKVQLRVSSLATDLPAAVLTNIYALQQTAEIARNQYQILLVRLKELEAQAYLQVADSRIVARATAPTRPSFPDTKLFLVLAGIMSLILGIGTATLVENFIGGFTSVGQLQSVLHNAVVSSIPKTKPKGGKDASLADLMVEAPLSIYSESIRRIQIGIDQAMRRNRIGTSSKKGAATIMVTSANANEGKTTTALSLARSYALAGRSTLLIDCDLRKPSVHKHLGVQPSVGLMEYLSGAITDNELSSVLTTDPKSGARVIIGARGGQAPTDQLVTGGLFSRLLDIALTRFDIVILDTPPVGPVIDGLYFAQFADVIVAVTRWASTSQKEARSAMEALVDSKNPQTEIVSVLTQQELPRSHTKKIYSGYYSD